MAAAWDKMGWLDVVRRVEAQMENQYATLAVDRLVGCGEAEVTMVRQTRCMQEIVWKT